MVHCSNKKRAVARWLQILCLTALAALPQTAKADITADRMFGNMPAFKVITSTNSITLDDPYIVLSMNLIGNSSSKNYAYAWKDFSINITGPNGNAVSVASMADMGYATAYLFKNPLITSQSFYCPCTGKYSDNSSWTSGRAKINYYCTQNDMPYSFYGIQDGYYSAGGATGTDQDQYTVKIAILPGLFYYDRLGVNDAENETVTIRIEGTSIDINNNETAEIHKATVKLEIDEPKLKFARANGIVTCETDLCGNDNYDYNISLYDHNPTKHEVTIDDFRVVWDEVNEGFYSAPDEWLLPISTSEVVSTSFSSQVFAFNGMDIDNREPFIVHPVTRFSRKSHDVPDVYGFKKSIGSINQDFLCSFLI